MVRLVSSIDHIRSISLLGINNNNKRQKGNTMEYTIATISTVALAIIAIVGWVKFYNTQ